MRIVKVIHGYPMRYNAGSEVYSQALCHALADAHDVHVFTRQEDSFAQDYQVRTEQDGDDARVTLHLVNNARSRDRYRVSEIDQAFARLLERVQPDVVHVGHLNHLSTSVLKEAAVREVPIVFTLHDYWLMCPRGQFIQMFPENPGDPWAVCSGQEDRKCAERCYARYFSGGPADRDADVAHWTDWVASRMKHVRQMADLVDFFIAPSRYLYERYRDDFGVPERKLVYLDYGFTRDRLTGRARKLGEPFTFGYIGTHIPAKGIHDLLRAFTQLRGDARLRIWGRRGQDTDALIAITKSLPAAIAERVEWLGEYRNADIVPDVFDGVDAIVVPSMWVENSPLVIHEAQQARVPVITAAAGGMAEYVRHEVNGLLFEHRSVSSLIEQMQRVVDEPALAHRLGARGYLYTETGDVPSMEDHVREIEALYVTAVDRRNATRRASIAGPWRITFDTNPDTCNLQCIMCEEHSPHSPLQLARRSEGRPRRVLPFPVIERVVADAVPHGLREIIPSTMGEPLLYEHFDQIIELCERYRLKLNLTTNGTFPRLGAKAWAERIVPVASDVKISWNGATKATHEAIMLGCTWEQVLENVRTFVSVRDNHAATSSTRCRVTFQLTFLEANVRELADIVRLAVSLGVDRVKGHHLWAHFDEIRTLSMRRTSDSVRRWNAAVAEAQDAAAESKLPNGERILLENIFPVDENARDDLAPTGACPFLGREAWVSALGRFDPCCAPDAQRRELGEFGNLNDSGLLAIWNSGAYRELLATYRNRKLCVGCNMRKPDGSEP